MGFSEWPKGGDHFNIANDPIAWQVSLDSDVPVTIGDETVTLRDLSMTSSRAHTILDPAGDPGQYLAGLLDEWLAKNPELAVQVTGDKKLWGVWDEVAVAHMLGMTKPEPHATCSSSRQPTSWHGSHGRCYRVARTIGQFKSQWLRRQA
jgi:inosine-uridine nucleoside N-ribohydrolase